MKISVAAAGLSGFLCVGGVFAAVAAVCRHMPRYRRIRHAAAAADRALYPHLEGGCHRLWRYGSAGGRRRLYHGRGGGRVSLPPM